MKSFPILDLACPPRTDMLRFIRRIVLAAAHELGLPAEQASQIEISVDEACTNVIRHAYGEGESSDAVEAGIRLRIHFASDRVTIQITDSGCGMPPDGAHGATSLSEYIELAEPHGLGSLIINRFMDEVRYDSHTEKGTVLFMIKYLDRPSENVTTAV